MEWVVEKSDTIVRLLDAISEEIRLMADDISTLGQIVTTDLRGDSYARSRKREPFPALAERCEVHSHLIQVAAHVIESSRSDPAVAFAATIDTIPFRHVRERLDAALSQNASGRDAIALRNSRQLQSDGNESEPQLAEIPFK